MSIIAINCRKRQYFGFYTLLGVENLLLGWDHLTSLIAVLVAAKIVGLNVGIELG